MSGASGDPHEVSRRARAAASEFKALVTSATTSARRLNGRFAAFLGPCGPAHDPGAFFAMFEERRRAATERHARRLFPSSGQPARRLEKRFANLMDTPGGETKAVTMRNEIRLNAWHGLRGQLLEFVVLLELLNDRLWDPVTQPVDLTRPVGPLPVPSGTELWFVWYQEAMTGAVSGLKAIPDLCVTTSPDPPSLGNVAYVIDCKNVMVLDAATVRAEAGKAYDLQVASYVLLSYNRVSERVKEGAARLGVRVVESGLDGPNRGRYLASPTALGVDVLERVVAAVNARHTLQATNTASGAIRRKLSGFRRPGGSV